MIFLLLAFGASRFGLSRRNTNNLKVIKLI